MTDPAGPAAVDRLRMLGSQFWVVLSTPGPATTASDIETVVPEHLTWLLEKERAGLVFLSGPLTSGPDVRPGSGITVLRADDASHAADIASQDPFVRRGLRSFEVFGWVLNEGSLTVRLSLGTGTYDFD